MERYLITPSGHGAGAPWRTMRWQRKAHEDYLDGAPFVRAGVISIGAGNGKTTWGGALGLYGLCADLEESPEILAFSTKLDLAERCWRAAVSMIRRSPELETRLLVYDSDRDKRIVNPYNDGVFKPATAKTIEDLQGWNPSIALIDEIGFVPAFVFENLIVRGGKRPHSLILGIGTPGYDQGGMSELRRKAHEGELVDAGFIYTEYAARAGCRIDDRREWRVANPALKEGRMTEQALETSLRTTDERTFRVMHLGQWAGAVGSLFTPGELDDLGGAPTPTPDEQIVWGFDGSSSGDATVIGWGRRGTGDIGLVAAWERPEGESGVDWKVPRAQVLETLRAHLSAWASSVLVADPWHWQTELEELESEYNTDPARPRIYRINTNSIARFGRMADRLIADVRADPPTLRHDSNPVLLRHMYNTHARLTPAGTVIEKSKKMGVRKIDATIAVTLAHDHALTITDDAWPKQRTKTRIY